MFPYGVSLPALPLADRVDGPPPALRFAVLETIGISNALLAALVTGGQATDALIYSPQREIPARPAEHWRPTDLMLTSLCW